MPYYKVVSRNSKKLYSAISNKAKFKCSPLRYIQNKWTYPKIKGSKLFVFDNYSEASNFAYWASFFGKCAVYECEVINPSEAPPLTIISNMRYMTPEMYWMFKQQGKFTGTEGTDCRLMYVTENTVFCDAVMITRKMKQMKEG